MLNVQGNLKLKITHKLLENTTLQTIIGMSTSEKKCTNCNVTRQKTTLEAIITSSTLRCLYVPETNRNKFDDIFTRIAVFQGSCAASSEKKCVAYSTDVSLIKELLRDICRETVSSLRPINIILGVFALIFNSVVILVIVASKPLRGKITFILMTHMAFSDVLIGIYAIAVGDGHKTIYEGTFRSWRKLSCPYFRTIFVFGQILEVATSLLLTTELYLSIVFCMNPLVRLSKRIAVILLTFTWVFAAVMCFMIQYHDRSIITDNTMCVSVRKLDLHDTYFLYSQGIMLSIVAVYIVTIIQYVHIYLVVRKSSQNMASRSDTSLAFRICIMVMSSCAFLAVPNIIVFIVSALTISFEQPAQILLYQWLPPTLLVFNACLNPILLAYRNKKFIDALKQHKTKLLLTTGCHRVLRSFRQTFGRGSHRNYAFDLDERSRDHNRDVVTDKQDTKL